MSSSDRPDLLVAYDFPPLGGGIARMLAEVARRYPGPGLAVATGTLPESDDEAYPLGVHRVGVPSGRLRTLPGLIRWTRHVSRVVTDTGARFLWCGNLRPAGLVTRQAASTASVPYGLIVYGGDVVGLERKVDSSRWQRWRVRRDLDHAAVIVAISQWTGRRIASLASSTGSDAAERIQVVPLGSDPTRFGPSSEAVRTRRGRILSEGRWLLTVARLVPHKGVDVALETVAILAERFPALRYAVVGDGPARAQLELRASRLGIADRVRWFGSVPDSDLPDLYAAAEVYLGLSREEGTDVEGFGIALADGAAAGLPVVAGRSGGTADAVRDGVTGVLVDPTSASDAGRAVAALLSDPARRRAYGSAGRRLVESTLNWDRVARELAALARAATEPGGVRQSSSSGQR